MHVNALTAAVLISLIIKTSLVAGTISGEAFDRWITIRLENEVRSAL